MFESTASTITLRTNTNEEQRTSLLFVGNLNDKTVSRGGDTELQVVFDHLLSFGGQGIALELKLIRAVGYGMNGQRHKVSLLERWSEQLAYQRRCKLTESLAFSRISRDSRLGIGVLLLCVVFFVGFLLFVFVLVFF